MRRLFVFAIALMLCAPRNARALDGGISDGGSIDAGSSDAGSTDASTSDAATTDASSVDASDASDDDSGGPVTFRPDDPGDNEIPGDSEEASTGGGCSCRASGVDGGSLSACLLVALALASRRKRT